MTVNRIDPSTRFVIIGAGVVGAALADELTLRGLTSVTVVDQGPLYRTGGSSSHAPGFAFQTTGSPVMTELARRTLDKLDGLDLDGEWLIKRVGGLELACDPERLEYIHRRFNLAQSWGVPSRIVSGQECAELFPGLDPSVILGGLHTPTDAVLKCVRSIEWQARRAIEHGAEFYGHTQVIGYRIDGGRIRGVQVRRTPEVPGNPSKGPSVPNGTDFLPADIVVVCAGLWGPGLAAKVGIELPMVPMEHTTSMTTTMPSWAGFDELVELDRPMVRHQATGSYFRQYGDHIAWGSYEHRVMPLEQADIATPEEFSHTRVEPATHALTWDDLAPAWDVMHMLVPETRQTQPTDGYNGIFSFTPDGNPLLGEIPGISGLWLGESVWLTQSAGVAQVLADWIVTGDPGVDTTELDHRRFDQTHLTRTVSIARASENYDRIYDVAHPRSQTQALRRFSTTPFYLRQQARDAVFGYTRTWERPLWYASSTPDKVVTRDPWCSYEWSPAVTVEALGTLRGAGLFDRGTVSIFQVSGPGATGHLSRLAGAALDLGVDECTPLLVASPAGGIAASLTVIRDDETRFTVVGCVPEDKWQLLADLPEDATVTDVSSGTAGLALIGPAAAGILAAVVRGDLPDHDRNDAPMLDVAGVPVRAVPDRETGTCGWTLYFAVEHGLYLWDALVDAGADRRLVLAGDNAFDALRLANGVPAFGVDYGPQDTPAEAGLADPATDPEPRRGHRVLVRLELHDEQHAVVSGEPVVHNGTVVGYVTSAAESLLSGRFLAFAWVDQDVAEVGTTVRIAYFDRHHPAQITQSALARRPVTVPA